MNDIDYMKLALELAGKGAGHVSPNPLVGAVIVKDGKIIGTGYHEKYGGLHAERNALASCTESPVDATIYVTLEPCCHQGKQPPCTDAILDSGISRVVVGSVDPNEKVAGKGIRILKEHGITVETGILQEECDKLNEIFFHYIQTGTPFVAMKYAMTIDGKIATKTGASRWISGEESRKFTHTLRNRYSAIMVGVQTVIADDPLLNCRLEEGRNPIRIICDTNLRTPLDSQIVKSADKIPTIIATCCNEGQKHEPFMNSGCRILTISEKDGRVNLCELMKRLGSEGIDSILLEGGACMHWSALKSGIVKKAFTFIAPKIFGGSLAKSPVEGEGVCNPSEAFLFQNSTVSKIGNDFLIESEVIPNVHGNY